jgi:hypothetical protein
LTIETHPFVTRVEPEPAHDKPGLMPAIDELVTGPLDSFHIERMADDIYWMALYKDDVRQVLVISSLSGRAKIVARTEAD